MSAVYTSSSLLLIAALVGPASGAFPTRFVHHSRAHHSTHHLQELNQAMVDLQHAKAALAMKNGGPPPSTSPGRPGRLRRPPSTTTGITWRRRGRG